MTARAAGTRKRGLSANAVPLGICHAAASPWSTRRLAPGTEKNSRLEAPHVRRGAVSASFKAWTRRSLVAGDGLPTRPLRLEARAQERCVQVRLEAARHIDARDVAEAQDLVRELFGTAAHVLQELPPAGPAVVIELPAES
jgi:hypothetical protein